MKKHKSIWLAIFVAVCFLLSVGCGSQSESNPQANEESMGTDVPAENTANEGDPSISEEKENAQDNQSSEEIVLVEFKNEDKNFKLMHPSDWIIVDRERYGVVLRPKEETQTTFYVDTYTTSFSDYTYDDFIDEMMGDVMRIRSEADFSEPETIEINGIPFVTHDYSEKSDDGILYLYRAFYTAKDIGYKMYFVMPETEYEMYAETMEEIALSFEFLR